MTSMLSISDDTDGLRASECHHAVEHARTDRHLGCLRAGFASPQAELESRGVLLIFQTDVLSVRTGPGCEPKGVTD